MKFLFIADKSFWSIRAGNYLTKSVKSCEKVYWEKNDAFPTVVKQWQGDYIISFKSDLILSEQILNNAAKGKINFHPSPPKYRGVEGYHWALLNKDDFFGTTCHHMIKKVDAGPIIEVSYFPILPTDDYKSLRYKAGKNSFIMFTNILKILLKNKPLKKSNEVWGEKLYTYEYFERSVK